MVVRLNPVEFAKAMMKKKKQLIPTPIVLDNGIAGIVYGYYEGEDFYYLDRLDVDVSKKEVLRKMNVMELRQEIALKSKRQVICWIENHIKKIDNYIEN